MSETKLEKLTAIHKSISEVIYFATVEYKYMDLTDFYMFRDVIEDELSEEDADDHKEAV